MILGLVLEVGWVVTYLFHLSCFNHFMSLFFVFQSGVVGGIMQVLLLSMSAHITKQLGMAPGGEFRAAFREVSKYFSYIVT